jgi:hypothetical protein
MSAASTDLRQPIAEAAISTGLQQTHRRLLDRLVAQQPNAGYSDPAQIASLTGPELAAVLESDETLLADAATHRALNTALVNILARAEYTTLEQAMLVGASLIAALMAHARVALLQTVQEEIARDEEKKRADESDERYLASMSAAVRGVWTP